MTTAVKSAMKELLGSFLDRDEPILRLGSVFVSNTNVSLCGSVNPEVADTAELRINGPPRPDHIQRGLRRGGEARDVLRGRDHSQDAGSRALRAQAASGAGGAATGDDPRTCADL